MFQPRGSKTEFPKQSLNNALSNHPQNNAPSKKAPSQNLNQKRLQTNRVQKCTPQKSPNKKGSKPEAPTRRFQQIGSGKREVPKKRFPNNDPNMRFQS